MEWNPADYAANSASQQSWAEELISRLRLQGDESILDVGCGDGKVSAALARMVPAGRVLGIDISPTMIHFARSTLERHANLEFELMDARRIRTSRRFDIVFSNAALHWVDDHPAFLAGVAEILRSGGRLMVSCGGRGNAHDVFLAVRAVMRRKRWQQCFRNLEKPYFFYSPEEYRQWLPRLGFDSKSVELVNKVTMFSDALKFAGWLRTTWLPYTQRVPLAEREEFIENVVQRYLARHPTDTDGRVHVKMVRLEIDAVRV